MSAEGDPRTCADSTTGAIYDIIETMGGDGGEPAGTATFTPAEQNGASVDERNGHIEKQLYDEGILPRISLNQRRLLGCVACRLGGGGDQEGEARIAEIAQCNNLTYEPARSLLDSLRDAGLLETEVKTVKGIGVNAPTKWYRFSAQARTTGFTGAVTAPEECQLAAGKPARAQRPYKPRPPVGKLTNDGLNRATEDFLIDKELFQHHSASRRAVLGCLACQLNKGEDGVFGLLVARCQGITHTTAGLIFTSLEKRGIVTRTQGEGQRVLYKLSIENHLGRGVDRLLEVPPECGAERTIGSEADTDS